MEREVDVRGLSSTRSEANLEGDAQERLASGKKIVGTGSHAFSSSITSTTSVSLASGFARDFLAFIANFDCFGSPEEVVFFSV